MSNRRQKQVFRPRFRRQNKAFQTKGLEKGELLSLVVYLGIRYENRLFFRNMDGEPSRISRKITAENRKNFVGVDGKGKFSPIHIVMGVRFQINRKEERNRKPDQNP